MNLVDWVVLDQFREYPHSPWRGRLNFSKTPQPAEKRIEKAEGVRCMWYLLTSPSEALRGHGWIGLLAGRAISRLPIRPGRTVAFLWIFFLLTVARAASEFHRSSRSSNHDKLIKCRGHHREAINICQGKRGKR